MDFQEFNKMQNNQIGLAADTSKTKKGEHSTKLIHIFILLFIIVGIIIIGLYSKSFTFDYFSNNAESTALEAPTTAAPIAVNIESENKPADNHETLATEIYDVFENSNKGGEDTVQLQENVKEVNIEKTDEPETSLTLTKIVGEQMKDKVVAVKSKKEIIEIPTTLEKIEKEPKKVITPAATPTAAPVKKKAGKTIKVQLAAFKKESEAESYWNKLMKGDYPDLKGKNRVIEKYQVDQDDGSKRTVYRLQLENFTDERAAHSFCDEMIKAKQSCFLVKFVSN